MQLQPLSSKIGEVKYRLQISKQHLNRETIFPNEPTLKEFKNLLASKLKETDKTFKMLQNRNLPLSPYLEIGSEHGLRPALLESKYKAVGFATDISLYSLSKTPQFVRKFNYEKIPKTICCDAYNLPFKSNSFPFVFIYETLHHFPEPKPVLEEIKRVLSPGGTLLVGSDPICATFQIKLWRRPTKLRVWEKILKFFLILPFISHIGKTEVEHGIIETAFPLKTWQDALSVFDKVEVTMKAFPFGPTQTVEKNYKKNWIFPKLKTQIALHLFGGGLEAICTKNGKFSNFNKHLKQLLICPDCLKHKKKERLLSQISKISYKCKSCHAIYSEKKQVLVLLESNLNKKLKIQ